MEKLPEKPKKPDYMKPDPEKQQVAKARGYFMKKGKLREFDESMREAKEESGTDEGISARERTERHYKGTVDKDILAEAARRKMREGGDRPLMDYYRDILGEQEHPDNDLKKAA